MVSGRNGLRIVDAPAPVVEVARFCTHCGADAGTSTLRVCTECHMGVILEVEAAAAPAPDVAFLIADASLNVGGVSHTAARWLGREEQDLVHRPLVELFEPAEVTKSAPRNLAGLIHTRLGDASSCTTVVRPAGMFGVHVKARFARCAPSGLLVVLDVPERRR